MAAMTPAQRQAAYRKRHRSAKSHINSQVSCVTKMNLWRLACRYGITQRAMLELLIQRESTAQSLPVGKQLSCNVIR
jgi:Replication regulatory protein RepB